MRTLLAILIGAAALALGAMSPAAAQQSSGPKCLVLDNVNRSLVVDVCKCQVVRGINAQIRNLLRPDPVKVAAKCPHINNGGGGGGLVVDVPNYPPEHGHGFSFSKAESSSSFVGVATVFRDTPVAATLLGEHTTSISVGDGGSSAGAGSSGNAVAVTGSSSSSSGSHGSTGGSTGGGSCAGTACGGGAPPSDGGSGS